MESIEKIAEIAAPFNKQLEFQDVIFENGFPLLRVRIREGRRFTIVDLDMSTLEQVQALCGAWLEKHRPEG